MLLRIIYNDAIARCQTLFYFLVFLSPRTKHLKFVSSEKRDYIHAQIKRELSELNTSDSSSSSERENEGPTAKRLKSNHEPALDWLDDIVQPTTAPAEYDMQSKSELEFMHYIAEPDSKEDALNWWRTMEPVFPLLSRVAKQYLCITASSVPSERIFSTADNLIKNRRASLSPENVDMLLFMHKNIKQI